MLILGGIEQNPGPFNVKTCVSTKKENPKIAYPRLSGRIPNILVYAVNLETDRFLNYSAKKGINYYIDLWAVASQAGTYDTCQVTDAIYDYMNGAKTVRTEFDPCPIARIVKE